MNRKKKKIWSGDRYSIITGLEFGKIPRKIYHDIKKLRHRNLTFKQDLIKSPRKAETNDKDDFCCIFMEDYLSLITH